MKWIKTFNEKKEETKKKLLDKKPRKKKEEKEKPYTGSVIRITTGNVAG
jgi:hypothetical protein